MGIGLSRHGENLKTRDLVLEEMGSMQSDFCEQLEVLQEGYLHPIQMYSARAAGSTRDPHGWLHQEFNTLSSAVGELLVRHNAAINPMLRAKQDDNELVNAFDSIFAARDAMSRFLHRLASVSSFISKGTKENPELKQTMATQRFTIAERTCKKVPSLASLLFKTLQQTVNYAALLERLLALSGPHHISCSMLRDLIHKVHRMNQDVDTSSKHFQELKALQASLHGFAVSLVAEGRHICGEFVGQIIEEDSNRQVKIVVMTDYLLLLAPCISVREVATVKKASRTPPPQFRVLKLLGRSTSWQPDALRAETSLETLPTDFALRSNNKTLTIRVESDVERVACMQLINAV